MRLYVHGELYPFLSDVDSFGYMQPVKDWIYRVARNRNFVHVGAGIGIHAINAACAGAGRIICFEPLAVAYTLHIDNYLINKKWFPLTQIYNCAVGDVTGLRSVYVPKGEIAMNTKVNWEIPVPIQMTRVNTVRLDSYLYSGECNAILIDAEGSEARVIRGMGSRLQEYSSRIVVSVVRSNLEFFGESVESLFKEWESYNFNFTFFPKEFDSFSFKGGHAYSAEEAIDLYNSVPDPALYVELVPYGEELYDV